MIFLGFKWPLKAQTVWNQARHLLFQLCDERSQGAHLLGSYIAKKGLGAVLNNLPKNGSGLQEAVIYNDLCTLNFVKKRLKFLNQSNNEP